MKTYISNLIQQTDLKIFPHNNWGINYKNDFVRRKIIPLVENAESIVENPVENGDKSKISQLSEINYGSEVNFVDNSNFTIDESKPAKHKTENQARNKTKNKVQKDNIINENKDSSKTLSSNNDTIQVKNNNENVAYNKTSTINKEKEIKKENVNADSLNPKETKLHTESNEQGYYLNEVINWIRNDPANEVKNFVTNESHQEQFFNKKVQQEIKNITNNSFFTPPFEDGNNENDSSTLTIGTINVIIDDQKNGSKKIIQQTEHIKSPPENKTSILNRYYLRV